MTTLRIELNVGLSIGEHNQESSNVGPSTVLRETADVFKPAYMVHQIKLSACGERTVCIKLITDECNPEHVPHRIHFLSTLLQQDCIAGKLNGVGFLYGPNTAPYGDAFDADHWLEA